MKQISFVKSLLRRKKNCKFLKWKNHKAFIMKENIGMVRLNLQRKLDEKQYNMI